MQQNWPRRLLVLVLLVLLFNTFDWRLIIYALAMCPNRFWLVATSP
jgi:hypothetical protein